MNKINKNHPVLPIISALLVLTGIMSPISSAFGAAEDEILAQKLVLKQSAESRMFNPPEPIEPDRVLKAVITGYSSTKDQTDDDPFIAASGKRVYDGMIANNCLKFGTKVKFPNLFGDKEFTVHDRMNSRYGCERFDIWFDLPKAEVRQFGVKRTAAEVYLIKKKTEIAKR